MAKIEKFVQKNQIPKSIPLDIGIIHFVGIGGIGMSGIAEILHNLGYEVSGSDISENYNIERLRKLGIKVSIGHEAKNVSDAAVVVKSTAVSMENPEIKAARDMKIPVVRRSEMLSELTRLKSTIAVAGTHGKTTTTSLIGMLFESAELDPTVINGGIINAYGTNTRLGEGDWLIAEADESDGTFIRIPATIGVATNIEPEHLDYYGSFDKLREAFHTFIQNLPFYGFAVLCADDPEVNKLIDEIYDRKVFTYGLEKGCDVHAINIRNEINGSTFDVEISSNMPGGKRVIKDIFLPTPGRHNVQNSLAAITIGVEMKLSDNIIKHGFENFSGVKRRFTKTGEYKGITVIDDYGHHPTEINATLKTAREVVKKGAKVIAVVQPHRYTRLKNLFKEFTGCFDSADVVIVANVYEAGEKPIEGANRDELVKALKKAKVDARPLDHQEQLPVLIKEIAASGDIVVCLGAGSITYWANELPMQMEID